MKQFIEVSHLLDRQVNAPARSETLHRYCTNASRLMDFQGGCTKNVLDLTEANILAVFRSKASEAIFATRKCVMDTYDIHPVDISRVGARGRADKSGHLHKVLLIFLNLH